MTSKENSRTTPMFFSIRNSSIRYFLSTFIDKIPKKKLVPLYSVYFKQMVTYMDMPSSEKKAKIRLAPCLTENTETTKFDAHYFYQDIWAFKKIIKARQESHVDVGSRIDFIGFLTAITKVTFVDIRPLMAVLENLDSRKGSILCMPYEKDSVKSLSCLHVAEHIGLGRYGDDLDPLGTKKACAELQRILAIDGNLYFSLPVGKPRTCFNAHRIHSPRQILEYFDGLTLVGFSGIDDHGNFRENISPNSLAEANYSCGLFHFTKK